MTRLPDVIADIETGPELTFRGTPLDNRTPRIPRAGRPELQAPGVAPVGTLDTPTVDAIVGILSGAGALAGRLIARSDEERVALRGQGVRAFREREADLREAIARGRVTRREDESAEDFARRVASGALGLDIRGEARSAFIEAAVGPLSAEAVRVTERMRASGVRDATEAVLVTAEGAPADRLDETIGTLLSVNPSLTRRQASELVASRSLRFAAESGDADLVSSLSEKFAEDFPTLVLTSQRTVAQRVAAGQRQADAEFQESFDRRVLTDPDFTPEARREALIAGLQSGASPGLIRTMLDRVNREERSRIGGAITDIDRQAAAAALSDRISAAEAALTDPTGSVSQFSDETITLPSGATVQIRADEVRETALNNVMRRIARVHADDPNRGLPQQIAVLARSGETYDQFRNIITAGVSAADVALFNRGDRGRVTVPEETQRAIELYGTIRAVAGPSSSVLARHTTADQRAFFEAIETAREINPDADGAQIIQNVARASANAGRVSRVRLDDDLRRKVPGRFRNAVNGSEVERRIEDLATFMVRLGAPQERAVKRAVEIVRQDTQIINGAAVQTGGRLLPEAFETGFGGVVTLDEVVRHAAERYIALAGADAGGLEADDLTVVPSSSRGVWVLTDKASLDPGFPVDGFDRVVTRSIRGEKVRVALGSFTLADFSNLAREIGGRREQTAAARAAQSQALRQAGFEPGSVEIPGLGETFITEGVIGALADVSGVAPFTSSVLLSAAAGRNVTINDRSDADAVLRDLLDQARDGASVIRDFVTGRLAPSVLKAFLSTGSAAAAR
ncbi:MAG: hypothetical protein D6692_09335 [Planctomycetota bacterium]|nr:MAG: hypothetical protein D6692_09335 [Planctomycetota bacterium]